MRVLLTGASGALGSYAVEALVDAGHEVLAWSHAERGRRGGLELHPVDLADRGSMLEALARADPGAVLHLAAVSSADAVLRDPARAQIVNVDATAALADWCRRRDRRIIYTSTDLVFDGSRPWNREADPAAPVLAYGRTKLAAEAPVLSAPRGLVARVSLLFGPSRSGRPAFFDRAVDALRAGQPQAYFDDEFRTPLDLATAAALLARLLDADSAGLVHLGGAERLSRFDLMRRAAAALGLDPSLVRANRRGDVPLPEPRPADVSLDTTRLASLLPGLHRPTVEEALAAGA